MLDWLKEVLATPTPSNLIKPEYLASLVKLFTWIIIAAVILHSGINLSVSFNQNINSTLSFDLPCLVSFVFLQSLFYRNRIRLGLHLWVYAVWLTLTVAIATAGGIHSIVFSGGYLIIILMTDFLLNFRSALIIAGLSALSGIGMALAGNHGSIVRPDPNFSAFLAVFGLALTIFATLALIRAINYRIYQIIDQIEAETIKRLTSESKLAIHERRFEALVEQNHDMVALVDAAAIISYASPSIERIMGYPTKLFKGTIAFDYLHPEDLARAQAVFARINAQAGSIQQAELRLRHLDGNWRWVDITGNNQTDNPDVGGIILNFRDITERKRQEEQREQDAIHDPLTGLYNRLLFINRLDNLIRRYQRSEETKFAVIVLDIDHFRNINDSLGHNAGDELLITVAHKLTGMIRAFDTVARLGGDEFAILLDQTDGSVDVESIVERIEKGITSEPIAISGRNLIITTSGGIVLGSSQYTRSEEYLRDAEIAMYRAKAWGRAQHVLFEDRMRAGILERVGLEAELRRALVKHEFVVFYQPIFSLRSGELTGFEALVRWEHPVRGLLLPAEFIEVAEDCGLIVEMDRWVMGEACRQNYEWQKRHPDSNPLIINVNLSRRQLIKPDLVEIVAQILEETYLDAHLLRPEITESLIMEDIDFAIDTLDKLSKIGVHAEIDDFGSGYSSLAVLTRLPVCTLKIDRSFVAAIGVERNEVIHAIIALGHSLNLEIIAEGIETKEQLKQLTELGCEYGQGFLFSKGLAPAGAEAMIARRVNVFSL